MADDLRVPKRRVTAEVALPGGRTRRIALFLADAAAEHSGPEVPSDLLNGGDDFLPALDEEAGVMTFLNRHGLAVVRVGREGVADDDAPTIPTEHEVELLLRDGTTLRGLVSYLRPPERARLVDYLNEPTPFLPLLEEHTLALVNKRHVSRVVLVKR
jgi:hypothetical protein